MWKDRPRITGLNGALLAFTVMSAPIFGCAVSSIQPIEPQPDKSSSETYPSLLVITPATSSDGLLPKPGEQLPFSPWTCIVPALCLGAGGWVIHSLNKNRETGIKLKMTPPNGSLSDEGTQSPIDGDMFYNANDPDERIPRNPNLTGSKPRAPIETPDERRRIDNILQKAARIDYRKSLKKKK